MAQNVAPEALGAQPGMMWGPLSDQASTTAPLAWNPEMDESPDSPPYMLMTDEYFTVYQRRRRRLVSGEAPKGVDGDRPMHAREWRACQNLTEEGADGGQPNVARRNGIVPLLFEVIEES